MQRSAARCDASPSRRRLSPSRQGRRHSRPGPGIEIPWRPRSSRSFPGEMWILSCSQNEVTIAAFPSDRNVLVATARDTRQASGFSWAGYYRSTDGGATWENALVPGFPGDTSPEGLSSPVHDAGWKIGSDPVITTDREGRVYLAWLAFGPSTTEFAGWVVLTRYSDFGATSDFTSVVFAGHDHPSDKLGAPGTSRVTDKEWIAVDDTGGSCDGNLYMPWAHFERG